MEGREAGSHGELNAGHMDQTKIQWAAGEVAAVFACQSTVPPQQRPDLPSSPSPLVCFLNTSVEQERTKPVGTTVPCWRLSWQLLKELIPHRTKGKKEDLSGRSVGRGIWPYTSTIPGGYRNPLVCTLGAQPAETPCPNQQSWDPRCRVWGLCGSHPIHMGHESVPRDPISVLYLQYVLSPQRFPASELRVLPWLICGPFSSLHHVEFTWGQAPLSGLLLCSSEWKPLEVSH